MGVFTARRRQVAGAWQYTKILVLQAVWIGGFIFETLSPSLAGKIFWDNVQWVPSLLIPVFQLSFAWTYTGRARSNPLRFYSPFLAVPGLALLAIFTNDLHGLALTEQSLRTLDGVVVYDYHFGPLLWLPILYSYGLVVSSILMLARCAWGQKSFSRAQTWIIVAGMCLPLLGSLLVFTGVQIGLQRDVSPYAFTLANLLVAYGLFRYHMFDIIPFARELVMDNMEDGVIILDTLGRLVDINNAACRLMNLGAGAMDGRPLNDILPGWLVQVEMDENTPSVRKEITLRKPEQEVTLDLRASRLTNEQGVYCGHMLLLRDVSELRRAADTLRRANLELEQRVEERTAALSDTVARLEEEVTERREVEEALRDSEGKFRTLIEQATEAFCLLGPDGRIMELNPAYERLSGRTRPELIGRFYWEVFHELSVPENRSPERLEFFKHILLDALESGSSPYFNRPRYGSLLRPDGTVREIQQNLFIVRTEHGNRIGSVILDTTEEKLAHEDALRQAENLNEVNNLALELTEVPTVEEVFQAVTLKIYHLTGALGCFSSIYQPDLQSLKCNYHKARTSFYEKLSTFIPECATGMEMPVSAEWKAAMMAEYVAVLPTLSEATLGLLPKAMARSAQDELEIGEILQMVFQLDDELLGSLVILMPQHQAALSVEMLKAFSNVVSVNLRRKRAEQALRSNEERLRSLLENSNELISVIDRRGRLKFTVNPESRRRVLGYPDNYLDGKSMLEFIHPDDLESVKHVLTAVGNNLHEEMKTEYRYRRADGDYIYVETYAKNLLDKPFIEGIVITSRDISERKLAEKQVQIAHQELNQAYEATLEGWSRALELRERETAGHSQRVVKLTLSMARQMGLPEEEIIYLQRGALLHDIGKMGIPDRILLKPEPLSPEEWVIMREHPDYARQLLTRIPYLSSSLDIPYNHHERWDGSGYPRGLRGESIPLSARIFAVVDVWDALGSDRPYRPAWPADAILTYMKEQSGRQFDPQVIDVFFGLMEKPGLVGASMQ